MKTITLPKAALTMIQPCVDSMHACIRSLERSGYDPVRRCPGLCRCQQQADDPPQAQPDQGRVERFIKAGFGPKLAAYAASIRLPSASSPK